MVSYKYDRLTVDGRPRAPLRLIGVNHVRPFPTLRFAAGVGFLCYVFYDKFLSDSYTTPQERFMRKIKIVDYGVLGTQLTLQGSLSKVAPLPDARTVVVDTASMKRIKGTAAGAGGSSGAIYHLLGLTGKFPDNVSNFIHRVCDARYHSYDGKNVIHVVGPDLREGKWSEREASIELSRAYRNVFHEFVLSNNDVLRVPPISSGVFAGPLYDQMPALTQQALSMAFEQLHEFDREYLLRENKSIELCIFMNREWDMYGAVFRFLKPTTKM
jgi:hypothetical protein